MTQKKPNIRPCMTVQIRCFHSFRGSWTSTVCCLTSCHSWLRFCWPVCAPTSCLCFRGILPSRSSISLLVFQSFSCTFQLFTSLCQFWPTLGEWWQHCFNLFCLTNPSSSITSHFYQGVEDDCQILFVFQGMTFGRLNQSRFFRGLVCYARKCVLLCPTASVILLFISQPACLRLWQLLLQS